MTSADLPSHSRYDSILAESAPASSGQAYYEVHASDVEPVVGQSDEELIGYVHSAQLGSTVDGPGLRFVAFLTGCLLRCQYCHNPDTWHKRNGKPFSVAQAMQVIGRSRPSAEDQQGRHYALGRRADVAASSSPPASFAAPRN